MYTRLSLQDLPVHVRDVRGLISQLDAKCERTHDPESADEHAQSLARGVHVEFVQASLGVGAAVIPSELVLLNELFVASSSETRVSIAGGAREIDGRAQ